MATVRTFITALGGPRTVATRLTIPITTVYSWQQHNAVPSWRIAKLAELAAERSIAVPASFGERRAK